MRVIPRLITSSLALALLAGCADQQPALTSPDLDGGGARFATMLETETGLIEPQRSEIDVTAWVDETEPFPLEHTPMLEGPNGIGPGSPILITIPNEGRFGCTANFVWRQGGTYYLGAAGHCFLPEAKTATHGPSADYDASGVTVQVCVETCEGNFRTALLVGKMVTLGKVTYARQTDPTGEEGVGNDFGVVEIPAAAHHLIRPQMPVWQGPSGSQTVELGDYGCHYGNGVGVGETVVTKARVGMVGGAEQDFWMGDFVGAFGDSGSGMVACVQEGTGFHGKGAAGVLTHLGVAIGNVKYKNLKFKAEHGVIFGTTIARAVEMAGEAGLKLELVSE